MDILFIIIIIVIIIVILFIVYITINSSKNIDVYNTHNFKIREYPTYVDISWDKIPNATEYTVEWDNTGYERRRRGYHGDTKINENRYRFEKRDCYYMRLLFGAFINGRWEKISNYIYVPGKNMLNTPVVSSYVGTVNEDGRFISMTFNYNPEYKYNIYLSDREIKNFDDIKFAWGNTGDVPEVKVLDIDEDKVWFAMQAYKEEECQSLISKSYYVTF